MGSLKSLFDPISLHKNEQSLRGEDHPTCAWSHTLKFEEYHRQTLFTCSVNNYLPDDCLSVVSVYEVPLDTNGLHLLSTYTFSAGKENIYSSAWCYDTYEAKMGRSPYMLVVGGDNGFIFVIDTARQKLVNRLVGHGGAVNEIRTCPTNSNLIASSSKDKSIRIWHIRNDGCLIVMGGPASHLDQILSLDWHSSGKNILSCGMDHTVLKWELAENREMKIIRNAEKMLSCGKRNILAVPHQAVVLQNTAPIDDTRHPDPKKRKPILENVFGANDEDNMALKETIEILARHTEDDIYLPVYSPVAKNCDMHADYVDCVRYFGKSDYIFSKGCGKEAAIAMWRFGTPKNVDTLRSSIPSYKPETSSVRLMTKSVPDGETWFIKFDIDPRNENSFAMTTGANDFYYSSKYEDDEYEYRHVHVTKEVAKLIPTNRLMSETEWRSLGIQQSPGWIHYMIHGPERHVLLFRRPLPKKKTDGVVASSGNAVGVR
ncbi:unnamed protein product [Caenorhabditis bovis]|uniref:Cyclin-dependent kinases regulatory subunit n=1 Tax=Caenorhabditis bovis TaxID=2654633 RepID=A0A8S1EW56_9PELO|nr:unnamed protein product [Caenorhabditis bovis]